MEVLLDERLLTPLDVAAILAVHRNTVYSLLERGDLHSVRVGRQRRVRPEDLRRYLGQAERP